MLFKARVMWKYNVYYIEFTLKLLHNYYLALVIFICTAENNEVDVILHYVLGRDVNNK